MKKITKLLLLLTATFLLTNGAVYAKDKEIKSVTITDIDEPYANGRTLDTVASIGKDDMCRITKIAWKTDSNTYKVYVTLKANINYVFAEDVAGTINGNANTSIEKIDEDEIIVSYVFTTKVSDNSTSTRRHRILTYFNSEEGRISPSIIRPMHGSNQILEIIPEEGYEIEDVKVDGESVGAVTKYEFRRIKENHGIRAYFKKSAQLAEADKPILKAIKDIINSIKNVK